MVLTGNVDWQSAMSETGIPVQQSTRYLQPCSADSGSGALILGVYCQFIANILVVYIELYDTH